MAPKEARRLAKRIRDARLAAGISASELSRRSGVNVATITRYERELIANPQPESLLPIANVLGIPTADIFALRRWVGKDDLPSFGSYLHARYEGLPDEAVDELRSHFHATALRYGFDSRPAPGEDEY